MTRLKLGIAEYLSVNSSKKKKSLEYNIGKIRTNLQMKTEKVSTKSVSRKRVIVIVVNLNLNTPPSVPSHIRQ